MNDPDWRINADKGPDEKITKYLITKDDYKPYRGLPPCRKLFEAGIYETNRRKAVTITENSKTLIQKLIKRI